MLVHGRAFSNRPQAMYLQSKLDAWHNKGSRQQQCNSKFRVAIGFVDFNRMAMHLLISDDLPDVAIRLCASIILLHSPVGDSGGPLYDSDNKVLFEVVSWARDAQM